MLIALTSNGISTLSKIVEKRAINREGNNLNQAKTFFYAPFGFYSHNMEKDPVHYYHDEQGLKLIIGNEKD